MLYSISMVYTQVEITYIYGKLFVNPSFSLLFQFCTFDCEKNNFICNCLNLILSRLFFYSFLLGAQILQIFRFSFSPTILFSSKLSKINLQEHRMQEIRELRLPQLDLHSTCFVNGKI